VTEKEGELKVKDQLLEEKEKEIQTLKDNEAHIQSAVSPISYLYSFYFILIIIHQIARCIITRNESTSRNIGKVKTVDKMKMYSYFKKKKKKKKTVKK
jgi:hypothetical protein